MILNGFVPGALVYRKDLHVGAVRHYGVVLVVGGPLVSDVLIAHIDKAATGALNIKREPLSAFAAGLAVQYEAIDTPVPLPTMWRRMDEVDAEKKKFGLLAFGERWNCESFARYVQSGDATSKQAVLAKTLLLAGVVGGLLGLARSGGGGFETTSEGGDPSGDD